MIQHVLLVLPGILLLVVVPMALVQVHATFVLQATQEPQMVALVGAVFVQ